MLESWYENGKLKSHFIFKDECYVMQKEWYDNGQLKYSIKYKKIIALINSAENKTNITSVDFLSNAEVHDGLKLYFSPIEFKTYLFSTKAAKESKLSIKSYFEFIFNDDWVGSLPFDISKSITKGILSCDIKVSVNSKSIKEIMKVRDYIPVGKLKLDFNGEESLGVIHLRLYPEGIKPPDKVNPDELMETYSYIEGEIIHYKENGTIDYIQTNNKFGIIIKVDLYEKGKLVKTVRFD